MYNVSKGRCDVCEIRKHIYMLNEGKAKSKYAYIYAKCSERQFLKKW